MGSNRTPAAVLLATLVFLGSTVTPTNAAASAGDWAQPGFDGTRSYFNPSETVVGTANVGHLVTKWTLGSSSNAITYSAPIVVGSRMYVTETNKASVNFLDAVDTSTGSVAYRVAVGKCPSAPLYDSGRIFLTVLTGTCHLSGAWPENLIALTAATGKKIWSVAVGGSGSGSPVIGSGLIFQVPLAKNGIRSPLVARSETTGKIVWSVTSPTGSSQTWLSDPVVLNGVVVSTASGPGSSNTIVGLAASTGKVIWSHTGPVAVDAASASADLVIGNPTQFTGNNAYDVRTGALRWNAPTTDGEFAVGASAAFGNCNEGGGLCATSLATGATIWSVGNDFAPTAVANGVVYGNNFGPGAFTQQLALSAKDGSVLGSVNGGVGEVLAVSHGMVYVLTQHQVLALAPS